MTFCLMGGIAAVSKQVERQYWRSIVEFSKVKILKRLGGSWVESTQVRLKSLAVVWSVKVKATDRLLPISFITVLRTNGECASR